MSRPYSHLLPTFLSLSTAIALTASGMLREARASESGSALRLVAGSVCEKGEKKEDIARVESSGVLFAARPLAEREWETRVEERSLGMGAAFRPADGTAAPLQVFLLEVQNRTRQLVRFQPGNLVRLLGDKDQDHILDYTDLYRYLHEQGKDPDSLGQIRDLFFDSGVTLEPGAALERLVFFRPFPEKGKKKRLALLVSSFQVGTETYQAMMGWHFEPEH